MADSSDDPMAQAGAVSLAALYQNLVHSSILSMQNAVQQQQNSWTVQSAVTAKLVQQILSDGMVPYGDPLADLLGFDDEDLDAFDEADDEEFF